MRTTALRLSLVICLHTIVVFGQGTFVYDQQSAVEGVGEGIIGITSVQQPVGQSFVPDQAFIGFIRLQPYDVNPLSGSGATLFVNLRTGSITGPVVASTDPVFLPNGFNGGYQNFFFSSPVPLIPGSTYYLQPLIQSGDAFAVGASSPRVYTRGTLFVQGIADPNNDLWFREGQYVPEPSALALLGLTTVCFIFRRHKADL